MAKHTAIKLQLEVGSDHTITLPDEVPVGPVEVIVLVAQPDDRAPGWPEGYFEDVVGRWQGELRDEL